MSAIQSLVDDIVQEDGEQDEEDWNSKALEHPDHVWFLLNFHLNQGSFMLMNKATEGIKITNYGAIFSLKN